MLSPALKHWAIGRVLTANFREDPESECFDASNRFIASGAVSEGAGDLGNLGDPTAVGFLIGFDGKCHEAMIA
jgi:hypothetical protein